LQLKSNESEVKLAEKREKARARHEADRYAAVPAFTEDMPIHAEPGATAGPDDREHDDVPATRTPGAPRDPEAAGRGRVVPPARGPVGRSGASGRVQPSRQTRSKRGKK
jgi:preprotein translocase subunit SecF